MIVVLEKPDILRHRWQVKLLATPFKVSFIFNGVEDEKSVSFDRLGSEELLHPGAHAQAVDEARDFRFLNLVGFDSGRNYRQEIPLEFMRSASLEYLKGGNHAVFAYEGRSRPPILFNYLTEYAGI